VSGDRKKERKREKKNNYKTTLSKGEKEGKEARGKESDIQTPTSLLLVGKKKKRDASSSA